MFKKMNNKIRNKVFTALTAIFFAFLSVFSPIMLPVNAYAEQEQMSEQAQKTEKEIADEESSQNTCESQAGKTSWIVCNATEFITDAVDSLYGIIKDILNVKPLLFDDSNENVTYIMWKYFRSATNIIFIIFLLIIIFSQITGRGITNYGIKSALPKLIIAVILVNLSYIICALVIDISNIFGQSLRGIFTSVKDAAIASGMTIAEDVSFGELLLAIIAGTAVAVGAAYISISKGTIFMFIVAILAALVAVVSGLITIALRQAVVMLLVMISPIAIVCQILPNTESLYKKWLDMLKQMLVFYPMFSLLFGASDLAGWAIIAGANNSFIIILGLGVQVYPLFYSWKLMRMSNTILGTLNEKMRNLGSKPVASAGQWAESRRQNRRAYYLANSNLPSARLQRYLANRKALREEDTKNNMAIANNRTKAYVQNKLAGLGIAENANGGRTVASRYTRAAKKAKNYDLIAKNAEANTEHVLSNYGDYYAKRKIDKKLNEQSKAAFKDFGRATLVREIDDENDIGFLTGEFIRANGRDKSGKLLDEVAHNRYIESVGGAYGEERVMSKIITQAAKVESKQRTEYSILLAKYGHNGFNKSEFRSWLTGFYINDDGWATDEKGKRLKDKETGKNLELIPGELLTKAPNKLVMYDKKDQYGLYFDMKDQDGNVIARIHRGIGENNINYDNAAFIKEVITNYDIPIGDPINDVYNILAGVKENSIKGPNGEDIPGSEYIGLSRYSTTIGRAMGTYKGNAAWAGSMFLSEVGNRQIKNSAQHSIAILDSIVKTLKPGNYNTQNPASVELISTILNPNNWNTIFDEESIASAVNINNKLLGGEDWIMENGKVKLDENGEICAQEVENPTYEQRMNKIKRKYLFPAMKKILPAFDRLRTNNTADNQKPGTADKQYEFLEMVDKQWIQCKDKNGIPIDIGLITQDLQNKAREFRDMKHDKNGNPIYNNAQNNKNRHNQNKTTIATSAINNTRYETRASLEYVYNSCFDADDYKNKIFQILDENPQCGRAIMQFEEFCDNNPTATIDDIRDEIENEISLLID